MGHSDLYSTWPRLKGGDNFRDRLAMGGIGFPRSLDHLPYPIREFRVVRSSRPAPL